jgi:hypothetical protein
VNSISGLDYCTSLFSIKLKFALPRKIKCSFPTQNFQSDIFKNNLEGTEAFIEVVLKKKNTEQLSFFTAMVLRKDAIIKYIAGKTRGDSAISILNPLFCYCTQ